jgi:hypothetical protein
MRTALFFVASTALFLSACSSGNKMHSSVQNDDLYTGKTESYVQSPSSSQPAQSNSMDYQQEEQLSQDNTTEKYSDENGTTFITNNYYGSSMNAGFGYGGYGPVNAGFTYYDPFYFSPGLSFSLGFSFGFGGGYYNPYYMPYYAYNPWYYTPWYYNPWYNPYYAYNPYCNYYYGGGYCYGGDGGYYGGYPSYYGPHGSSGSNSSSGGGDGRQLKLADNEIDHGIAEPGNNNANSNINQPITSQTSVANQGNHALVSDHGQTGIKDLQTPNPGYMNAEVEGLNTAPLLKSNPGGVKPAAPVTTKDPNKITLAKPEKSTRKLNLQGSQHEYSLDQQDNNGTYNRSGDDHSINGNNAPRNFNQDSGSRPGMGNRGDSGNPRRK